LGAGSAPGNKESAGINTDLTRLITFSASYFFIALSPGLCMTLAMSLGISIGVRRTLWMMVGELTGIALVGTCAVLGVAALLLQKATFFAVFKWVGAAYLLYMGWQAWHTELLHTKQVTGVNRRTRSALILQGFITAVTNPKAWVFFVALLPPFIDQSRPLASQLATLLVLMIIIEFTCLMIYAQGGRALSEQLLRHGKARWLNRIGGTMMMGVGIWLAFS